MTDLDMLIGSLDGMDIVEIGSGYGGQSKILFDVYNIKSYTYIDLEEVLFLAKKYISNFEINAELNFISYVDFVKHIKEKYDLIISNYAFSECEKNIQLEYINAVLNNSSNGYLLCNDISNMHNIDSLTKKELLASIKQNVVVEKEEPLTHPKNYLLYWKKETK